MPKDTSILEQNVVFAFDSVRMRRATDIRQESTGCHSAGPLTDNKVSKVAA